MKTTLDLSPGTLVAPQSFPSIHIIERSLYAFEFHKILLADPTDYASERREGETCAQATARIAVEHADALIKELSR